MRDTSLPPHKLWTREECSVLERTGLIDPRRFELIEGELISKVRKKHPHMRAVMLLVEWLRSVFGPSSVVQEPAIDVRPEDNPSSEPEPDAVVLNRSFLDLGRRPQSAEILLVAEVSDTTLNFDLGTKAALYARAGIPEYWVMDVAGQRLIVHRKPVGGRYSSIAAYAQTEHVATLASPDVDVLVGSLL